MQVLEAEHGVAHPAAHQRLGHVLLASDRSGQVAPRHELHHEIHAVLGPVVDDLVRVRVRVRVRLRLRLRLRLGVKG